MKAVQMAENKSNYSQSSKFTIETNVDSERYVVEGVADSVTFTTYQDEQAWRSLDYLPNSEVTVSMKVNAPYTVKKKDLNDIEYTASMSIDGNSMDELEAARKRAGAPGSASVIIKPEIRNEMIESTGPFVVQFRWRGNE